MVGLRLQDTGVDMDIEIEERVAHGLSENGREEPSAKSQKARTRMWGLQGPPALVARLQAYPFSEKRLARI